MAKTIFDNKKYFKSVCYKKGLFLIVNVLITYIKTVEDISGLRLEGRKNSSSPAECTVTILQKKSKASTAWLLLAGRLERVSNIGKGPISLHYCLLSMNDETANKQTIENKYI